MATLTFAAVEDLGHWDNNIPNPDLSEMDSDTPEKLCLPKCMARKASSFKKWTTLCNEVFFLSFFDDEMFLDLNIIPGHTESFCDELPIAKPMARRTPYALLSEDLPPVRCMGNWSPNSTYWWLTIFILGPNIHLGRTISHQTLVSNELPLGFPLVHTSKHQAPVSPKILSMGKKLRPTLGVSSRHNHPTSNPLRLTLKAPADKQRIHPSQSPGKWQWMTVKYFPCPGRSSIGSHPKGRVTMLYHSRIWDWFSHRKWPHNRLPYLCTHCLIVWPFMIPPIQR